jgi:hypothetical protein
LIESASKKASLIVDSALFVSQSVNIYARSTASESAYKKPYPIVVAYAKLQAKPIVSSTPKPSTSTSDGEDRCFLPTLPGIDISKVKIVKNISSRDSKIEQYIRKEHADALNYKGYISYAYNKVDLNGDGNPEVLVRVLSSFCGSGGCPVDILKFNGSRYLATDTSFLSWGRYIVTPNQTNGFKDIFYPHFIRNEKTYFLLKSSRQGRYKKVQEYTTNLQIKGTAYLVCGKYLGFSK